MMRYIDEVKLFFCMECLYEQEKEKQQDDERGQSDERPQEERLTLDR